MNTNTNVNLNTATQLLLACGIATSALVGGPASAAAQQPPDFELLVSDTPDRSGAGPLDGGEFVEVLYIFVSPSSSIVQARFYLDDPQRAGAPRQVENYAPYDFAGTTAGSVALPFDSTTLADGAHTVSVEIDSTSGETSVVDATFTLANLQPAVVFSTALLSLALEPDMLFVETIELGSNDGAATEFSVDHDAPWLSIDPAAGATPQALTLTIDTAGLPDGNHVAMVSAVSPTHQADVMSVSVSLGGSYDLLVSLEPQRLDPEPLHGSVATGDIYIFLAPAAGVDRVHFFLDDVTLSGTPMQVEGLAPYDFAGTGRHGLALPFDSATLSDGPHTVTALVERLDGGSEVIRADFDAGNSVAALVFEPVALTFDVQEGQVTAQPATLSTTDGGGADYSLSSDAAWLTAEPASAALPDQPDIALTVDSTGLTPGLHSAVVQASAPGLLTATIVVSVHVDIEGYALLVSDDAGRSGPEGLDGGIVDHDIYVFVSPEAGVKRVSFYLDDPLLDAALQVESRPPFDFAGTAADGSARPFDTLTLDDGAHTITAVIELSAGGSAAVAGAFEVSNGEPPLDLPDLLFVPQQLTLDLEADSLPTTLPATLLAEGDAAVDAAISVDAAWLTVEPAAGTTPTGLTLTADPADLQPGQHVARVTASAAGHDDAVLVITLTYAGGDCTPLPCAGILVELPLELEFDQDHGHLADGDGDGTGFTLVDAPPAGGPGYLPELLDLDAAADVLRIATTAGLNIVDANSLDNAVGVGFDAPSQVAVISTTLLDPPSGTGNYEQAGLWFGNDQDNYLKLVFNSTPSGTRVEGLLEIGGVVDDFSQTPTLTSPAELTLIMTANPAARTVAVAYQIGGNSAVPFRSFHAPPEFFSFDAAGIDPEIGTRSFAGLMTSHRRGPVALDYTFERFSITAQELPPPEHDLGFARSSTAITKPTSLAWGPDQRLYVTELLGTIHALTYGPDKQVVDHEIITGLTDAYGPRLTLGIAVDPASTASDVILWVTHSSSSLSDGLPNSGVVSRLSGVSFAVIDDVITGLPRAKANHAINALHFGPDGRLYIAVGGNTGAGAPNTAASEFGMMEEQPLSAALIVADVQAPGFDGTCHNAADIFGPPPCDVVTFATGLRNPYDFVFHTNGHMYAPDNGLGVTGSFPPSPLAPCLGLADPAPLSQGGDNPGTQSDILVLLAEGRYYGHPNPHRGECVFKDGSLQGVAPLPNYEPPIHAIGNNTSSNGAIEYTSDVFCGGLQGELLIANYSVGDNIVRIKLSADGRSVLSQEVLADGFDDPLPLTQGPDGTIYVGEFGGDRVTALAPLPSGCWSEALALPVSLLDAGGAALDGLFYVVAGKTSSEAVNTAFVYDPAADSWAPIAAVPGPGVENPAVVGLDGRLYAFGGSTAPFSGALARSAVYDPQTDTWTVLADMPTPRGGATAQAIDGLIYVLGGMDVSGASLDVVEVFDPATGTWSPAAAMATRRDNPASAVVHGHLYVFGGRTRLAGGPEVDGTLDTVEMYDPLIDTWTPRAPMPTGRRTMAVGLLGGRVQLLGGERTTDGQAFAQNEEYDPASDTWRPLTPMPTPRHGMASGTLGGVVYTAGGGIIAGSSFSSAVETFSMSQP